MESTDSILLKKEQKEPTRILELSSITLSATNISWRDLLGLKSSDSPISIAVFCTHMKNTKSKLKLIISPTKKPLSTILSCMDLDKLQSKKKKTFSSLKQMVLSKITSEKLLTISGERFFMNSMKEILSLEK